MLHSVLAVMQHDLHGLLHRQRTRYAVHLLLLATLVIVVSWPGNQPALNGTTPRTLIWWAYANTYLLGIVTLAGAAHALPLPDDILPYDWLTYGATHPLAVMAGKLVAGIVTASAWTLVSVPLCVTARLVVPNGPQPPQLVTLHMLWLVVATALTPVGVLLAQTVQKRPLRNWLVHVLWLLALVAPSVALPLDEFPGLLTTIRHLVDGGSLGSQSDNLVTVVITWLAVGAAAGVWAVIDMNRWRERSRNQHARS